MGFSLKKLISAPASVISNTASGIGSLTSGDISGAFKSFGQAGMSSNPYTIQADMAGINPFTSGGAGINIPGTSYTSGQQRAERFADLAAGRAFAQGIVPEGSLGRLGTNADISSSLDRFKQLSTGLTAPEMQAERDLATQGINRSTELARRRLKAAQAGAGVRGATASAQQADVINQGIGATKDFERDLMLRNREAQRQGAADLLSQARGISQFDLSQAARERFAELSTGIGFSQIGSAERSGVSAGNAAVQAAQAQAPSGGLLGGVLGK